MYVDPLQQGRVPDALTTARQFVQGLGAALGDQSYAYTDAVPYNPSGQFQTVGVGGITAVEGQPQLLSGSLNVAGFKLSPVAVIALGVVGFLAYRAMR